MARMCNRTVPKTNEPCWYPTISTSPMCYWHRLARTTPHGQNTERLIRIKKFNDSGRARREKVPTTEWPVGERWCSDCQTFVPIWYTIGAKCKACADNRRRVNRDSETYGLTEEYRKVLNERQNYRCAICRNKQNDRFLAVEHDHTTGDIRGLACVKCNHDLLGGANDSLIRVVSAASYLIAPPATGKWVPPEASANRIIEAIKRELEAIREEIGEGEEL